MCASNGCSLFSRKINLSQPPRCGFKRGKIVAPKKPIAHTLRFPPHPKNGQVKEENGSNQDIPISFFSFRKPQSLLSSRGGKEKCVYIPLPPPLFPHLSIPPRKALFHTLADLGRDSPMLHFVQSNIQRGLNNWENFFKTM